MLPFKITLSFAKPCKLIINYPEREKTINLRSNSKGIRLDVNRSFDKLDNLTKRMRYYQGLIDMDKLKHGQQICHYFHLTVRPF